VVDEGAIHVPEDGGGEEIVSTELKFRGTGVLF
jgi:hypothetical protein